MCTRCVQMCTGCFFYYVYKMCTDVYRCVQEKNGATIKEFFDVYKMCTNVYKDVYRVCTWCVQSLVHLSADPNFCNGCICNGYICPTATFAQLLHLPNDYIRHGYICPTATFSQRLYLPNSYIRSDYICAGCHQRRRQRATGTSVNSGTDLCSPPAAVFDVYKMCTDVYEEKMAPPLRSFLMFHLKFIVPFLESS